ncbi:UNVERIFIED_CONTAM: hypothetical protein GTU68_018230 [Idotea baltica]|nr:hypothetical protein [Idotea baltica]
MKLISWNVNGLRAVFKKGFRDFLNEFDADIYCLQEIKVLEEQLGEAEAAPEGYHYVYSSAKRKGYSGVACLIRDGIEYSIVSRGLGDPRFDEEGRYLILRFKNFDLYNLYIPSGSSGEERLAFKYEFLDHFIEHLRGLSQEEKDRLVLCGDFNICHKEIDIHHPKIATARELSGFLPEERAWMDLLVDLGLEDSFRREYPDLADTYSWWSYRAGSRGKNLGWRLDYFFLAKALKSKSVDILKNRLGSASLSGFV